MSIHTRKLPWPMSRVERDVLHSLWLESQRTGLPITEIVKEAVDTHLNRRLSPSFAAESAVEYQPDEVHVEPLPAA
jgi:hypothetical protein